MATVEAPALQPTSTGDIVLRALDVTVAFGEAVVLDRLTLDGRRG